jgi:serine/threonine protein phosphatase 1
MGRIIVCGDIHGNYKGLKQCLERSNFDYENDTLIQLGDVVDGWNEVYEVVEELLKIKNLIAIKGNHDDWFNHYLELGSHPVDWLQGGQGTLESYCKHCNSSYIPRMGGFTTTLNNAFIPKSHIEFFNKQLKYYKDDQNNIFVHGGFNRHELLKDQNYDDVFWWDRDLWMAALSFKDLVNNKYKLKIKEPCKEIFIGHTATVNLGTDKPMKGSMIWNLDTGSGFRGKLTFMDINTKEYWQSDRVDELYKDQKGRN